MTAPPTRRGRLRVSGGGMQGCRVGALGAGPASRGGALVDERGVVVPERLGWSLDWRIGADDRWRNPRHETAVRQSLVDGAPVVRTSMRVPGGDAVAEVYGVPEAGGALVVEVTNDSPAPFVVAFVVRGARAVAVDDSLVRVDRRPGLLLPRAPSRWSVAVGRSTDTEVCGGAAREGAFPATRDRAGRVEAAFLVPVPHRVAVRAVVAPEGTADPRSLPSATEVARGWRARLDAAARVELPDEGLSEAVRAARAQVLLAVQRTSPRGVDVAALEDWGFDREFEDAWRRLGGRERRRAASRPTRPPQLAELDALTAAAATPAGLGAVAAELLLCVRALLAWESDDEVQLLPELPPSWRGRPLEVHDLPTRGGPISYAVRWHGPRPALLWSAPPGVTVRAPGLDAEWSTHDPRGEALLTGTAA